MERLAALTARMDEFFGIEACGPDPSSSLRIPQLYDPLGLDWQYVFAPGFVRLFNGLMLEGAEDVGTVFCSVLPAPEVLETFLDRAQEGDLLFLHHPADIECGDPLGDLGRGFIPISLPHIDRLRARKLSLYVCHAPLDLHAEVGTTSAMVKAVGGHVEEGFRPCGGGYAGAICAVDPISTQDLMALVRYVFGIAFVDFAGRLHRQVTRMAVTAGAGCDVALMRQAEASGAQAYLTGEIFDRADDERAYRVFKDTQDYARTTGMSMLGVSHAASEFLVMKTQLVPWLRASFRVGAEVIPLRRWWR